MDQQVNVEPQVAATPAEPQADINPGAIRKSTTQSILKAAGAATGLEFDSVESMMAALARLGAQGAMNANNVEPTPQPAKKQPKTDLEEQFQSLRADLQKKEQALREKELDGEIRSAMGDKFDSDLVDYALSKVKSNIQWEDGAYQIVNSRGQVRYGEDGQPLTISGLVSEVAKSNPKLLKMTNTGSGSGLRPGAGPQFGAGPETMPDYATDPAGFKAWAASKGLTRGNGLKTMNVNLTTFDTAKKVF